MSPGAWLGRLIGALVALRAAWRTSRGRERPRPSAAGSDGAGPPQVDPSRRTLPATRGSETTVALLLFGAAACALAFVAFYIVKQYDTRLLGLSIGIAFALLAAAAIVAGKLVVPQETSVEPRDELLEGPAVEEVVETIEAGADGISRRGLLTCATCLAGGAVATAVVTPLASLGPASHSLHASPWSRGVRLVDTDGRPLSADEIKIASFYTALPEGKNPETFGAGLLVVRLPPHLIHLPASRRNWAPDGILAFSKICPHAGCAISLYRYPTYSPTSVAEPAFTCPCHYSTFTPGDGGKVIFGPAGRSLPQLPLMIDADGNLRAAGAFDQDVGPSWWGVRRT